MADLKTNVVAAWESRLSSALASGATTINVSDTTGAPAVPFYAVIDPGNDAKRETVLVDGTKTATTFTLSGPSSRGQDGSSDIAHDPDAVIAVVPVAAHINDLHDRVDARATALTSHEGAADPHPGYVTDADLTAHEGAADPHPGYVTDADLTAHEGAADPHPGYLTPAEGNAAYEAKVSRTGAATGEVPTLQGDGTLAFAATASVAAWSAAKVDTNESTTSTALTDLTTAGPAVTVDIGASGAALVVVSARIYGDAAGTSGLMSFAVSGASAVAGGDDRSLIVTSAAASYYDAASRMFHITGLTAGSNTFTAKYRRLGGGSATFGFRGIAVLPL